MVVLSDRDRTLQPGWPVSTAWERKPAARLPPGLKEVWAMLSGEPEVWTASVPPAQGGGIACLVAICDADRSQFAAWRQAREEGLVPDRGIVSIADRGQRFQGQRSRTWTALEGNIHLCACFRPRTDAATIGAGWTLLPAVAAVEAVREVCGPRVAPGIKWVNDVWMEGLKVAGVLTGTQVRDQAVEQVVFGVGMNVRQAPALAPTPWGLTAGCLRDLAGMPDLSPVQVLFPLIRAVARWYRTLITQGPDPLLEAYRRDSLVLGRQVRILEDFGDGDVPSAPPRVLAEGVVESIEPDLSLRLRGQASPVRSGRLTFVHPGPGGS